MAACSSVGCKAHHRAEAASTPSTSAAAAKPKASKPRARRRAHEAPPVLMRSEAFPAKRQQPERFESVGPRPTRCREMAGGTAAGCAAVCCCFPCAAVEVVVLATVRAPAALCRRAARAHRRRRAASTGQLATMYELLVDDGREGEPAEAAMVWPADAPTAEMGELEKEVWATFCGAGFWRSPSQITEELR